MVLRYILLVDNRAPHIASHFHLLGDCPNIAHSFLDRHAELFSIGKYLD
jgi:hypothetical protein